MTDLRLVGVHDDGEHLLLSGTGGEIFLLPIDEALRLATTRSPRTTFQPPASSTRLSPREIQAQIRAGASAADVAEHSGLSLEQVRRYEGPVLAEREHVAAQARKVEVSSPAAGHDGYRSAFGDDPATLDEMVSHRLSAFGIEPGSVRWDAWRIHDNSWTVIADFDPGTEHAASSIGEPAPARWTYHTSRKSLVNANRWAQQLSELEPVDGPVPERRLSAVADRPFDFEADTAVVEEPDDAVLAEEEFPGHGLLDMLRSRRGQRLGADESGDDDLAAMLGTHVPAAHPRDGQDTAEPVEPAADTEPDVPVTATAKRLRAIPFLSLAPTLLPTAQDAAAPAGVGEVSVQTREITVSGAPSLRQSAVAHGVDTTAPVSEPPVAPVPPEAVPSDSEIAARLERKASAKPKRSSVPSWDEIVFGTKGD